mmetsp:Transcript_8458/g.14004  ORF Transcript_8458/g.14004 Transcript_8458/m.14004 type:complete len:362 (+) Transcript_8458:129-1214(+)
MFSVGVEDKSVPIDEGKEESSLDGQPAPAEDVGEEQESRPPPNTMQHGASSSPSSYKSIMRKVQHFRLLCGKIVNNERVQLFIVFLIAVNAVMMGVGTFDFVTKNPEVDSAFETIDQVFLIIFTVEISLQLIYHGHRLFLDGWLIFDFIIIVVSWSFSSVQIIRAFRIFRALRLVTRVKVMKNLVTAVFSVMPRMAAIALLLVLIFYIFAVMMTQLFKDLYEEGKTTENYFSRLDHTLFTLFQIMTLDAWGDIAREVTDDLPWAWVPILVFVTISGFIVVNLIIAVICDAVSSLHDDVKAKIHGTYEEEASDDGTNQMDVREQLVSLEDQVDELTRVQEKMLNVLEHLTHTFQHPEVTSET